MNFFIVCKPPSGRQVRDQRTQTVAWPHKLVQLETLVPMKPFFRKQIQIVCPTSVRGDSPPPSTVHWFINISQNWPVSALVSCGFCILFFLQFFSILSISFFSISFLISDNHFRFIRIHQTLKHQFSWQSVNVVYRGFELHKPELWSQNRFSDLNRCLKFTLNEKNFLLKQNSVRMMFSSALVHWFANDKEVWNRLECISGKTSLANW